MDEENNFKRFYYLLNKNNLISKNNTSNTEQLLKEAYVLEENITNKFYDEYRDIRYKLFQHLVENNSNIEKSLLLEKTQKILDRVIFICFCEDIGLLPVNVLRKIIENAKNSFDASDLKIWRESKNLFRSINYGNHDMDINKYNGGLFADDDILDTLIIKDSVITEVLRIANYDFESELNVNILGHIFEQSITDIEKIKAEINEGIPTEDIGKRRSDGIYYTPEHITRYIVIEAIGKWLEEKKIELGFYELPKLTDQDMKSIKRTRTKNKLQFNDNIKKHINFWENYRNKVQNIKVLDPACGSGAFLIQVFDYLYQEGQSINKALDKLKGGQAEIFELDKIILQNNLYGVDLNQESVEITKLSLWLKTANKNKELASLDENIKCGNSLVDDENIVGNKAFKWNEIFNQILPEGFDVIVGNPPYEVLSEKESGVKEIDKIISYAQNHVVLSNAIKGKNNLYKFFICKGIELLKNNGYFSFIVPMALLGDNQACTVRKYLLEKTSIIRMECFPQKDDPNNRVFKEAKIATCIFVTKKTENENEFTVRTHSGKWIEFDSKNVLKINKNEIYKFDSFNLTIPNCNNEDWEIVKKIINQKFFVRLGTLAKQYQGEINETVQGAEGVLTDDNSFVPILRGANITMYAVREASQGESLFLNDSKYLQDKESNSKAYHHGYNRVGFQRSSPQNNFRRIIAAPIEKGLYCFDTVSYVTSKSTKIDLDVLVSLLNSNLYDWYFRCFSTNSKINEYQFNMLPYFSTEETGNNGIDNFISENKYAELINQTKKDIKEMGIVPNWVVEVIKVLSQKIQEIEKNRVISSRKERSKLDNNAGSLQRYINYLLYTIFGLTDDEMNYVEARREEML